MRTLRFQHKLTQRQTGTGKYIVQFGLRVGYWPCLTGWFIAAYVGKHRLYLWHGLASYDAT